jgi:hypothetical protein
MATARWYNNQLLFDSGQFAANDDCCCRQPPPPQYTYAAIVTICNADKIQDWYRDAMLNGLYMSDPAVHMPKACGGAMYSTELYFMSQFNLLNHRYCGPQVGGFCFTDGKDYPKGAFPAEGATWDDGCPTEKSAEPREFGPNQPLGGQDLTRFPIGTPPVRRGPAGLGSNYFSTMQRPGEPPNHFPAFGFLCASTYQLVEGIWVPYMSALCTAYDNYQEAGIGFDLPE